MAQKNNYWKLFGSNGELLIDCLFDAEREIKLAETALYRIARSLGYEPIEIEVERSKGDGIAFLLKVGSVKEEGSLMLVKQ